MKKIYTLLLLVLVFTANAQIAQWNFDGSVNTPTTGIGTLTLIGGTEENIQTGTGACNCPYVAGNPSTGKAYTIKTFPALGTASGTAGFQFLVSTVNNTNITVTFDPRGSNTSSRFQQYQYTTDGTNWIVLSNNGGALTSSFLTTPVSLTMPAVCDNKSSFGFRIVSIFNPASSDYSPVGFAATPTPSNYAVTGAWRIDNFTVSGTNLSVNQNQIAGLSIQPNPVSNGVFYVNTTANETKNVAIVDLLGKQVINTTTSGNAINVANLNAGVYIVKITEEGKTATRKLVIQ